MIRPAVWIMIVGLLVSSLAAAQTLSESTYQQLSRIHEHIDDEQYDAALRKLESLLTVVRRDAYEHAMVLQTTGFVHAQRGDYAEAARHFRQALELEALPASQAASMQYQLGQFHVALEEYREGAAVLEDYLRSAPSPVPPQAKVLLATAYAQLNEYRRALPPLREALREAEAPQEAWFQLQLALQYELEDYPASAATLLAMIGRFPLQESYWRQLAGIFLELRRDPDALAILSLAERQGYIDAEEEILNLANLSLYLDIPYKAARRLEQGLARGAVERSAENHARLADAWLAAKETESAIAALEQASRLSEDGELLLRLAYLYLEQENWQKLLPALEQARDLGVDQPGAAALLQGIAASELGRLDEALRAFAVATQYADTREQARAWQRHTLSLTTEIESES